MTKQILLLKAKDHFCALFWMLFYRALLLLDFWIKIIYNRLMISGVTMKGEY